MLATARKLNLDTFAPREQGFLVSLPSLLFQHRQPPTTINS